MPSDFFFSCCHCVRSRPVYCPKGGIFMAYEIIYHTEKKSQIPRFCIYATAGLLLFGCLQWQGLLPESAALSILVESLQAGQGIQEAVSTFCQEIFSHG